MRISPDGTQLLFPAYFPTVGELKPSDALFIMNVDGTGVRKLFDSTDHVGLAIMAVYR